MAVPVLQHSGEFALIRTKRSKSAPVGVIGKVLRLLELLDRSPAGLQLKEIAEQTGINKSTAHRFLTHLETEGYLFRDGVGTYMLGPKLARLGGGGNFQATLCRICRPTLENLWKITGETVNLAVLDGTDILYLDVMESLHTFRLVSQVGMRRPLYCTALGKSILANTDDAQNKDDLFASIHFDPSTPKTVNNILRLKKDLAGILQRGYAIDDEEAVMGARCVGAAILDADGKAVAGISVSGPVVRVTKERLPMFSAAVLSAAREISARLGHREAEPAPMSPATVHREAEPAPTSPAKVHRASRAKSASAG